MTAVPFDNARLLSRPAIDAHWGRYGLQDGRNINHVPAWLMHFLPWQLCESDRVQVIGHEPTAGPPPPPPGRNAEAYDNDAAGIVDIGAEISYVPANPATQPKASTTIELKQLSALSQVRDATHFLLSDTHPITPFQKDAILFALHRRWEFVAINGQTGSSPDPAEFRGLLRLAADGFGQEIDATGVLDPLNALELAIERVVSNNRCPNLIVCNEQTQRELIELQRLQGFAPDFRVSPVTGCNVMHYEGLPVCISNFIPNTPNPAGDLFSSIIVLTLGGDNGVYGVLNKDVPSVVFRQTQIPSPPYHAWQGHLFSAIVSTTSDALAVLQNFPVTLVGGQPAPPTP